MKTTISSEHFTIEQSADALNVSAVFVERLLNEGQIVAHDVEGQQRIRVADLMAYKAVDDESRAKIADQLTAEGQELDMGY